MSSRLVSPMIGNSRFAVGMYVAGISPKRAHSPSIFTIFTPFTNFCILHSCNSSKSSLLLDTHIKLHAESRITIRFLVDALIGNFLCPFLACPALSFNKRASVMPSTCSIVSFFTSLFPSCGLMDWGFV